MATALQVGWRGPNTSASISSSFPAVKKCPWSEDSEKMVELMMGQFERRIETLDLLGGSSTTLVASELDPEKPLPCGWEKCLDLKTGMVYYENSSSGAKTITDPRPSSWSKQYISWATVSGNGESVSRNHLPTKDSSSCVSFLSMRSMECAAKTMLNQFADDARCEQLLLGSTAWEAKLMEVGWRNKRVKEETALNGLELKLLTEAPIKEEKAHTLPTSGESLLDSTEKKETESKPSFLQPNSSRGPISNPTDHILSLHTREEPQKGEEAAAICKETINKRSIDQAMAILGCPCCLMYVMLSKMDPRCPKCGSSVLVDLPSYRGSSKRLKFS